MLTARNGSAAAALALGRTAERTFREVSAELAERYPQQTTRRSFSEADLGDALVARDRFGEAEPHYVEALRLHLVERSRGDKLWATIQTNRAYIRLRQGRPAEALALAREAQAATDPAALSSAERAQAAGVLGAALAATVGDGAALMREARAVLATDLSAGHPVLRTLDRQLHRH